MMFYLIFSFILIFSGLAWYRPVLAIQLTLFSLPAYLVRFNFGAPLTMLEVMILLNFVIWFIKEWRGLLSGIKNRFGNNKLIVIEYPFALEMMAILVISFLAVGVAHFSNEAMGIWKAYFFEPLLFLILLYNVFGKSKIDLVERLGLIIRPLGYSALAVGIIAAYQKLTGNFIANPLWAAEETRRVVSVFGYPNAVGLYVESIIFLSVGFMWTEFNKKDKALVTLQNCLLFLSAMFSVLAIAFARSNGAALGLVAGFSVMALIYSKKSRLVWLAAVSIVVLIVFGFGFKRDKALEYLTLNDFSGQVRRIGWSETVNMLKDHRWFFGAGLASFQKTVAPYHVPGFYYNRDKDADFHRKLVIFDQNYRNKFWQPLEIYMYPHNIFLNFWSELGLLGMLLFVWLIGKTLYVSTKMYYRMKSPETGRLILLATIGGLVAMTIHGLVDVPYFKNDLAVIFWLLIGIVGFFKLDLLTSKK
ncbi:MAG: O-antigen ligase family protein [bacterium]